jgi:hypothetical protein
VVLHGHIKSKGDGHNNENSKGEGRNNGNSKGEEHENENNKGEGTPTVKQHEDEAREEHASVEVGKATASTFPGLVLPVTAH